MNIPFLKNTNLFTLITKSLIIVLPFYVIIKVYFDKVIGFGFFGFFIKEFLVILLFFSFLYEYFFNKKNSKYKIKLGIIDYLIFWFILYWISITLLNWLWFSNILYWWRYDFLWFVVFLIFKHSKVFLKEKTLNLIKLFLVCWGISLFLWIMVKFILWEEILSLFWFTIQVTQFWFGWWIPIYQWVEASWIRRFQWILDSPLAMWYFLILLSWLFLHINRKNIDFSVLLWTAILMTFIFLTYSRAAMLWVLIAWALFFILNIKYILKYFKKPLIILSLLWIILIWTISYIFQDKIHNVFLRSSSTSGHIIRMNIWFDRFLEKPLWAGLATAWPAYRSVTNEKQSLETDRYHIPESWFVQILVEWGLIYFILFMAILWNILLNLYRNNNHYIFLMFIWVLIMNIFLHIFEYTYITILLFLFLAIFYRWAKFAKN